ncbi:GEVED domain-containing protein [Aquimarina sp. 2201CG1-2-11]|uniref:GEVED domain-containing protein n=1 Tax=Aquimarina discodermiae TaxID=3231043 RepID=UPI0034619F96
MKNYYQILGAFLLFFISAITSTAQEHNSCSFPKGMGEYYQENPDELAKNIAFMKKAEFKKELFNNAKYSKKASKYIIPVVFHIYGNDWPITNDKNVDVTEERVRQAVADINANFQGFNDSVDPAFANIEGGMDIEFKLAQIDPDGNTTNGIIFHEYKEGFGLNGTNDAEIAKFAWDNYKYMNVHMQLIIKAGSKTQSGIAWFPATGMSDEGIARVVYNGRYTIYDPPASSLTHEFGHWLGLDHTFGGGGCVAGDDNGDKVADTPPTKGNTSAAPGGRSCVSGKTNCFGNLINHQNHMDYNPCESMFTKGQVARMTTWLDHDARKTLWTDANLIATGVKNDLGARVLFNYQLPDDSDIDKSLNILEDFANNGAIQNKKRIKAVGGAKFAVTGNLQLGTHFSASGVPAGLTPVLNVTDDENAILSFTGNATNHEENNSTTVTITILNPAITGGVSSLHSTSGTFKLKFLDTYQIYYESYSPFLHIGRSGTNPVSDVNSKFNSLIIGGQLRTRLKMYDGDQLTIDNFAQGFEILCDANTINVKYFSENTNINANTSGTWAKKPESSIVSPPVLSSPTYTTWRNRTGYVAIRVPTPTGTYVYGWLKAIVSSNGEEADVTSFALNPDPGKAITARVERAHLIYSSDRFLESVKNDNTIENEITVDLKSTTFSKTGALSRGVHYTVENIPPGLILKVNATSSTQVKLRMEGVMDGINSSSATKAWAAVRDIKFKFLDVAFVNPNVEFKDFNFGIEKIGKSYIGNNVARATFSVGQSLSSPPGQFTMINFTDQLSNRSSSYQFQEYPASNTNNEFPGIKLISFRKDAVANNNFELTPLNKGVLIGPNSSWKQGRQYHLGRGQHMLISDTYTAWRGRTAYVGVRIRRSGRMHYGWIKIKVSSNGTQITVEEYGISGIPEADIRAGELTSNSVQDYCTAGSSFGPDHIKRVTFANIDNSTARPDSGYDDQSDNVAKLVRGESYDIKVEISGNSTNEIYAFFDWNQDKDYRDTGERIELDIPNGQTTGEATVTVPTNALLEGSSIRFRVSRSNNTNDCGSTGTGEVEDYGMFISNEEIATCEDGIKNGDEEKIDCGGSCKPCEVFTEICAAETTDANNTLNITNVSFGSINNSTIIHNSYNNFTSQTTNLEKGQSTTLTVTLNNNWDPNQVMVWIDWYNDKDFLNTEDVVMQKSGKGPSGAIYSTSVTPPADAVINTSLRMRVRAGYTDIPSPCGTRTGLGEVEDYTITIGGSAPVDTQSPSSPTNLATANVAQTTLILTWNAATDNVGVTGYEVFRNNQSQGTVSTTSFNDSGLTAGTTYTYFVRALDAAGNSTNSSAINVTTDSDTTNPDPTLPTGYCNAGNQGGNNIAEVIFGDINNTSGNSAYSDFTSQSTNVTKGQTLSLTVNPNPALSNWSSNVVGAWIDWNRDGDFEDAGEEVLMKSPGSGGETANVTVPNDAQSGATKLRVRYKWFSNPDPCGTSSNNGNEVEDYTVVIGGSTPVDTQAPTSPTNVVASNVAQTTLILTWNAATDNVGVTGYEVFRNNQSQGTVSTTSFNDSGLTAGTTYTYFVRALDAASNFANSGSINVTTQQTTPTVNGGTVVTNDNQIQVTTITGDGIADVISFTNANSSGTNYSYLITDANDNVLVVETASHDFEGATVGICKVYGIAYEGTLNAVGKAITDSSLASGNFDVSSNSITVDRISPTNPSPTYCSATGNAGPEGITNVTFAGINNSSVRNASGYDDFTSISGNVNAGSSYNLRVDIAGYNGGADDEIYAFFDWNSDGDFADADESLELTKTGNLVGEISVTIPQTAVAGDIRMRLLVSYYPLEKNPCDTGTNDVRYGEYEDYTLNITAAKSLSLRTSFFKIVNIPVKSGDDLRVKFDSTVSGSAKLELYSSNGTKVLDRAIQNIGENTISIDVSALSNGLYFAKIQNQNQQETKRVMIGR